MDLLSRRAFLWGAAAVPVAPAIANVAVGANPSLVPGGAPGTPQPAMRVIGWVPAAPFVDEIYRLLQCPTDWLERLPSGGHRLLDRSGEPVRADKAAPEALMPLRDGQIVILERDEDYGTAEVAANPAATSALDRNICSREWPVGAISVFEIGEGENCGDRLHELECPPGETITVRFVGWTPHEFVYRAATGALEPLDPTSLGVVAACADADGWSA